MYKRQVVLTFSDKASADKFMAIEFISFRGDCLDMIAMEEVIKKKEEDKKKRLDNQGGYYYFREDQGGLICNMLDFVAEKRRQDCVVVCNGFPKDTNVQEIVNYMYDNHENVIDVDLDVSNR